MQRRRCAITFDFKICRLHFTSNRETCRYRRTENNVADESHLKSRLVLITTAADLLDRDALAEFYLVDYIILLKVVYDVVYHCKIIYKKKKNTMLDLIIYTQLSKNNDLTVHFAN